MDKECPTNKECPTFIKGGVIQPSGCTFGERSSPTKEDLGKEFLDSLNEKERMAYDIAKSHLGTMFSLDKSNAFLEWVKERDAKERDAKEA